MNDTYKIARKRTISLPEGHSKLLLHCCCSTCSGETIEFLKKSGINLTVYFFNPNIYPETEYLKRKDDLKVFCNRLGIHFIDGDYDHQAWLSSIKGFENEPERGKRCQNCFRLRMDATAILADELNFTLIATTMGISRFKNLSQVDQAGFDSVKDLSSVTYWDYNWRKDGGGARMYELAEREDFYRQEYCGCEYSVRKNE